MPEGLVLVRVFDEDLKREHGEFMRVSPNRAMLGVRYGRWKKVNPSEEKEFREAKRFFKHAKLESIPEIGWSGPVNKTVDIGWVQDSELGFTGGAEISGEHVMRVGLNCGFGIDVITPQNFDRRNLMKCRLLVLNNIWKFDDNQMKVLNEVLFEDRVPYVKYEHDHRELTRSEFSRRLFGRAKLNVFLSPMHMKNHCNELDVKGMAIPLSINVDQFKPVEGVKREKGTALISNFRHFKTWDNLQAFVDAHPELTFIILGANAFVGGRNVRFRDRVEHAQMPALYSQFEYLVHLLDGFGAGERVVFEAALCGCTVVTNDLVGHKSWGKDLKDVEGLRKWLADAPYEFWRNIEDILEQVK